MNNTRYVLAIAGIALIGAMAFGLSAQGDEPETDGSEAMCPVHTTDCVDADLDGQRLDADAIDALEQEARGLLGRYEADLPGDVRIGRVGDEHMMLTEDFVLGRLTVGLEDTDGSGLRVVDVTVELPSGTATYTLQAG